jgi:hypothetical protein
MTHRIVIALTASSIAFSLTLGGLLTWVLVDPHHWFPGAYAGAETKDRSGGAARSVCQGRPDRWVRMPLTQSTSSARASTTSKDRCLPSGMTSPRSATTLA